MTRENKQSTLKDKKTEERQLVFLGLFEASGMKVSLFDIEQILFGATYCGNCNKRRKVSYIFAKLYVNFLYSNPQVC